MHKLTFEISSKAGVTQETVNIHQAIIAGWTGRDQDALEKHIIELEELGIARPATTPIFYRVSAARITQSDIIEVTGKNSSGEIEFFLLKHDGSLFLGIGSDHTDRDVESYGVTVSKQMCDKPVAKQLWHFDDVAEHWDNLLLSSWIDDGRLYQDGGVTAMRTPQELMEKFSSAGLEDGTIMFCGTLAAIGGIRPAGEFRFALEDPILGRKIEHAYKIKELEILG